MSDPEALTRLAQQAIADNREPSSSDAPAGRNYQRPPLHLWHPELSGEIDIRIDAEGNWYHEGTRIQRESLVKLFASILRREDDDNYYLVTPAEKWRIRVDLHPLMLVDVTYDDQQEPVLHATLNTGQTLAIGVEFPLFADDRVDGVAAVKLWNGLSALCTRAAWLSLVALGEEEDDGVWIRSGSQRYRLGVL